MRCNVCCRHVSLQAPISDKLTFFSPNKNNITIELKNFRIWPWYIYQKTLFTFYQNFKNPHWNISYFSLDFHAKFHILTRLTLNNLAVAPGSTLSTRNKCDRFITNPINSENDKFFRLLWIEVSDVIFNLLIRYLAQAHTAPTLCSVLN